VIETRRLFESFNRGDIVLVVPTFAFYEVASTILRAITIQGSHVGSVDELKAVVALARQGKIKPIPFEKRPLSEVSRTLDELKVGSVVGRVVVEI